MATTFHRSHFAAADATSVAAARAGRQRLASALTVVSATSLSAEGELRGMARPAIPNYALRRLLVGAAAVVVAVCTLAAAVGVSAGFGGAPAAASGAVPAAAAAPTSVHVAQSGDTLWSIADEHRGELGRDRYIEALIRLNGDTGVIAGEAIWLP